MLYMLDCLFELECQEEKKFKENFFTFMLMICCACPLLCDSKFASTGEIGS